MIFSHVQLVLASGKNVKILKSVSSRSKDLTDYTSESIKLSDSEPLDTKTLKKGLETSVETTSKIKNPDDQENAKLVQLDGDKGIKLSHDLIGEIVKDANAVEDDGDDEDVDATGTHP